MLRVKSMEFSIVEGDRCGRQFFSRTYVLHVVIHKIELQKKKKKKGQQQQEEEEEQNKGHIVNIDFPTSIREKG